MPGRRPLSQARERGRGEGETRFTSSDSLIPGSGQVWRLYYYAGGVRVAEREATSSSETLYYLLSDHLGSTSLTADPLDGDKLNELRYKAWGETRYALTSLPTDRRYTGQIEEAGIGLFFFNTRWYDSALGRWAQPDSFCAGAEPGCPGVG